jgi:hypothetical protein
MEGSWDLLSLFLDSGITKSGMGILRYWLASCPKSEGMGDRFDFAKLDSMKLFRRPVWSFIYFITPIAPRGFVRGDGEKSASSGDVGGIGDANWNSLAVFWVSEVEGMEVINGFIDGEATSNEDGETTWLDEGIWTNGGVLLLRGTNTFVPICMDVAVGLK